MQLQINPLASHLDDDILPHNLHNIWVFYEPQKITLWNTEHFVKKKAENVQYVSKNSVHIFVGQKYKMHIKYLLPTCSTKLLLQHVLATILGHFQAASKFSNI